MSERARIVGAGVVSRTRVVGSVLPAHALSAADSLPRWGALFDQPNPTFRRLDLLSRCVTLATEAAGVASSIRAELRAETALVLCTRHGCLDSDLRFAASLAPGALLQPAVFPYTLPSTCLGELAIRHGFQGPLLCLTATSARAATALDEAHTLLELGDARAAVVCFGDGVSGARAAALGVPARAEMASLVLAAEGERAVDEGALLAADEPIEWLAEALTARSGCR